MTIRFLVPASIALAAAVVVASPALAFRDGGGHGDFGESQWNDLQRSPGLIEPGAERQRYLEYYGGAGWDRRQSAYYGSQYYQPNVRVRPYRGYPY